MGGHQEVGPYWEPVTATPQPCHGDWSQTRSCTDRSLCGPWCPFPLGIHLGVELRGCMVTVSRFQTAHSVCHATTTSGVRGLRCLHVSADTGCRLSLWPVSPPALIWAPRDGPFTPGPQRVLTGFLIPVAPARGPLAPAEARGCVAPALPHPTSILPPSKIPFSPSTGPLKCWGSVGFASALLLYSKAPHFINLTPWGNSNTPGLPLNVSHST